MIVAKFLDYYGNAIVVDHGSGWQTLYAQLSAFHVRDGDCVTSHTLVGEVGSTGLSSGPHLHFEVRRYNKAVDPMLVRLKKRPGMDDQK